MPAETLLDHMNTMRMQLMTNSANVITNNENISRYKKQHQLLCIYVPCALAIKPDTTWHSIVESCRHTPVLHHAIT